MVGQTVSAWFKKEAESVEKTIQHDSMDKRPTNKKLRQLNGIYGNYSLNYGNYVL